MDTKLVVEQMSGRWQIKHPGLRPLAAEAAALAGRFESVRYTWIPREQNRRADALANAAMDGREPPPSRSLGRAIGAAAGAGRRAAAPWAPPPAGSGDPAGAGPARRDRADRAAPLLRVAATSRCPPTGLAQAAAVAAATGRDGPAGAVRGQLAAGPLPADRGGDRGRVSGGCRYRWSLT